MEAYSLPSSLTIETVEPFLESLKELSLSDGLKVDAAQVEIITTPGVQVILALAKSLEKAEVAFTLLHPSPAFTQTFATLGLSEQLTQWSKTDA